MSMWRSSVDMGRDERGFTLAEVLITVVLMGLVLAIASSTYFGVVESRGVDSAANQLASELRLTHTNAANRLAPYRVELVTGSRTYRVGPAGGTLATRSLPENTKLATSVSAMEFKPDGAALVTGSGDIVVEAENGGPPDHTLQLNATTSRVRIID